jgi:DNA-binding transcriptional regulator LsrR (DeoR family)
MVQRLAPALPPARQAANIAPHAIRHLAAQGCSQREIAGTLGLTRYQVRKALAA